MKIGRNDPCPCGSGTKYKQCCLTTTTVSDTDTLAWRRVRRSLEPLAGLLRREAIRLFGPDASLEARAELFLQNEEWEIQAANDFDPLFFSFFYFDWLPDPHTTRLQSPLPIDTVAQSLQASQSHRLDAIARRYLDACSESTTTFYDILEVRPGKGLRVRDMLREEELEVLEATASQTLLRGDAVFGRIVPIEGIHIIECLGPVAIPPAFKPQIIELRRRLRKPRRKGDLQPHDREMRELYLSIALGILHPKQPQLRNTDGDAMEAHTLSFDLDAPEAAAKALAPLGLAPADELLNYDADRRFESAEIDWVRSKKDRTVLGVIRISGKRLTADVNSQRRAVAIRKLIEDKLGDTAHVRPTVIQSAQSICREVEGRDVDDDATVMPEIQTLMTQHMRNHYARWVDEQIPALGGKTPRQAIRSRDGRESVAALVDQLERHGKDLTPPLDPSIVAQLRATLKLPKPDSD